jgi:hypothetical protein
MQSFLLSMLPHVAGKCDIIVTSQSRIAFAKFLKFVEIYRKRALDGYLCCLALNYLIFIYFFFSLTSSTYSLYAQSFIVAADHTQ